MSAAIGVLATDDGARAVGASLGLPVLAAPEGAPLLLVSTARGC